MTSKALTPKNTAKYLGVTTRCLQDWRSKKIGPSYVKAGDARRGTILYRKSDLDSWMAQNVVATAPQAAINQ